MKIALGILPVKQLPQPLYFFNKTNYISVSDIDYILSPNLITYRIDVIYLFLHECNTYNSKLHTYKVFIIVIMLSLRKIKGVLGDNWCFELALIKVNLYIR